MDIPCYIKIKFNHEEHEGHEEKMKFNELSNKVIACAIEVHRTLAPGLLDWLMNNA